MGMYLNPGNSGFKRILKDYYVDKTGMIELINNRIDSMSNLVCISRPRRFGKSYAAQMLCAYYDHTFDSHNLFDDKIISTTEKYDDHINEYQVIYLDMSNILGKVKPEQLIPFIEENITSELLSYYPEVEKGSTFDKTLMNAVESGKPKFIMIIDEWDAPIRETPQITKEYLLFLRMLFKSSNTTSKIFAAAYMTGILPIKKDGSESAISDFDEYSVLDPGEFAPYTGFTEDEVKALCENYSMDFQKAKEWYDGYSFGECHSIYNPYSVMQAMKRKSFKSYWRKTSKAEALTTYVNMNFDDLQEKILRLIAGEPIQVYTEDFENDFQTFNSSDDVLTLMIHLGYLVYDEETSQARIPNEELKNVFRRLIQRPTNVKLSELVEKSNKLFIDTLSGNETAVANAIELIRQTNYAPQYYNNEQSLRYAIKFAYITLMDRYMKIEELPSGKGLADIVYIPVNGSNDPALVIELKWNETTEVAISQIKNKHYPSVLQPYQGKIVLVGINYDSDTGEHSCKIEKIIK